MIRRTLTLMASSMLFVGAAHASFTGLADASAWSTSLTAGSNASATFAADGSSLTLVSTDVTDPASALWGQASSLSESISFSQDVTLSFDWAYTTLDDSSTKDLLSYAINGVIYQLSVNDLWEDQSGNVSGLVLHAGDQFSFVSASTDSIFGAATATISGFTVTTAVPEPTSAALLLAGVTVLFARRLGGQRRV